MKEVFVDATYKTNRQGYELYGLVCEKEFITLPLAYLLLDTRNAPRELKRGHMLAIFFNHLKAEGLRPEWFLSDKDFAEITGALAVWKGTGMHYQLCLWHARRAIKKRLSGKIKVDGHTGESAEPNFISQSILRANNPDYLCWLEDESDWIQKGLDRADGDIRIHPNTLCTEDEANYILNLTELHFNQHPYFPRVVRDDAGQPIQLIPAELPVPVGNRFPPPIPAAVHGIQDERVGPREQRPIRNLSGREDIHSRAVRELFDYCRRIDNPGAFRYLWTNWYRQTGPNGSPLGRWELVAISQSTDVPRARTTMRAEAQWRTLKTCYLYQHNRPRLDFLVHIIVDRFYPNQLRKWRDACKARIKPRIFSTFVREWRVASERAQLEGVETTKERGIATYGANTVLWTCGCPSYVKFGYRVCKHLLAQLEARDGHEHPLCPSYNPRMFRRSPPMIDRFLRSHRHELAYAVDVRDNGDGDDGRHEGDDHNGDNDDGNDRRDEGNDHNGDNDGNDRRDEGVGGGSGDKSENTTATDINEITRYIHNLRPFDPSHGRLVSPPHGNPNDPNIWPILERIIMHIKASKGNQKMQLEIFKGMNLARYGKVSGDWEAIAARAQEMGSDNTRGVPEEIGRPGDVVNSVVETRAPAGSGIRVTELGEIGGIGTKETPKERISQVYDDIIAQFDLGVSDDDERNEQDHPDAWPVLRRIIAHLESSKGQKDMQAHIFKTMNLARYQKPSKNWLTSRSARQAKPHTNCAPVGTQFDR